MTLRAMQINVSGLRAESDAIGVAGDNIANVNTTGYKRQREWFEDVLNRNGGASGGFGAGVRMSDVQNVFTQGALAQTGMATDLAINGDGFFAVAGNVGGLQSTFYTRAGEFRMNPSGAVVNAGGLTLLGRTILPDGSLAASVGPLTVPTSGLAARPTAGMALVANLDSSRQPSATPFDVQNPASTADAGSAVAVYDSLGASHDLQVYFKKISDGSWEYHVVADGADVDPPQPGTNVEVGNGSLSFTSDGALQDVVASQIVDVSFTGGATPNQSIALDFGTPISAGGDGLTGTTQFAMASAVSSMSQDGYSSGAASGVSIMPDGTVLGQYTNGQSLPIGQVVLAQFRSTNGLGRAGEGLFIQTSESGQAVLAAPGAGGRGTLTSGALEGSNVDMGEEMVGIIRHQRAFGANSKVISTADDMLASLMSLKQ